MKSDLTAHVRAMNKRGRCPICGERIDVNHGCNAVPLFEGTCCGACSFRHVIPARVALLEGNHSEYELILWFASRLALLTKDYIESKNWRYTNE